jgi:transcriptional regulator with XRE-family HTH domain
MTTWNPETIRALKLKLGLSWAGLGDACGVSPRTARYWCQGEGTEPGRNAREKLDKLARAAAKKDAKR